MFFKLVLQGGGRSSARETIGRVAAGAVAKKILKMKCGTEVGMCVILCSTISTLVLLSYICSSLVSDVILQLRLLLIDYKLCVLDDVRASNTTPKYCHWHNLYIISMFWERDVDVNMLLLSRY